MGLDITAYSKLVKAAPHEGLTDPDDHDNPELLDGYTKLYLNDDFPGRADEFEHRGVYRYAEELGFRAGSYGGYNEWREQLAAMVGYTPVDSWEGKAEGKPFVEMVNFADNEGTLGTAVCKKLAADFAAHQAQADDQDEWFGDRYADWRRAFELASDGGAVEFH